MIFISVLRLADGPLLSQVFGQIMMAGKKLVVITGASRGLGRAMAFEFARLGHRVIGCARSSVGVAELQSRLRPPHEFEPVDVAIEAQVQAWVERSLKAHGPPDLVLNNAALINRLAPLWEISDAELGEIFTVNVRGTANVIRHYLPAMIRAGRGVIVNFSSGWGRSTDSRVAPYCATKFAIEGLTQALAQELPAGLAAIPLNPGIINTEMLESCFGNAASGYPTPGRWARTAVPFLLGLGPGDNGQPLTAP